jgi:hypothetical protein
MIQQNIISSPTQPIELQKTKIRNQNTLIVILLTLGVALLFSLYVYQAASLYSSKLTLAAKEQAFARTERLNAEALVYYAQTNSMETMVRRASNAGFGPAEASQFQYVYIRQPAVTLMPSNEIVARQ